MQVFRFFTEIKLWAINFWNSQGHYWPLIDKVGISSHRWQSVAVAFISRLIQRILILNTPLFCCFFWIQIKTGSRIRDKHPGSATRVGSMLARVFFWMYDSGVGVSFVYKKAQNVYINQQPINFITKNTCPIFSSILLKVHTQLDKLLFSTMIRVDSANIIFCNGK